MTGVTQLNMEIGPKHLELMHEVVPAAKDIALLVNPKNPNADSMSKNLQTAAGMRGVTLHVLNGGSESDIDAAIDTAVQLRAGGLVLGGDPAINTLSDISPRWHCVTSCPRSISRACSRRPAV